MHTFIQSAKLQQRCLALTDHIGPLPTWPQWLRNAVQADRLRAADFFGLGRCLLGDGLSPAHFAAFVVCAGFATDPSSRYKARRLLERFRAGELRTYYDLTFRQGQLVRRPPQDAVWWEPAAFARLSVAPAALHSPPAEPRTIMLERRAPV